MTQKQHRLSISSYYRRLAGHELEPAQWWLSALRAAALYNLLVQDAEQNYMER